MGHFGTVVLFAIAAVAMGDLRQPLTDKQIQELEAKWDEVRNCCQKLYFQDLTQREEEKKKT